VNVQAFNSIAARRALAANIVTAAITSAALHAQIDTTERLITLAERHARDTARRYTLGAVSHADMLNAQQSAASLAASLPGLQQQWVSTRHALAVLLGRTPDAAPPDLDRAQLRVPEQVPVVVPSELLRARPDIQAADAAVKAAAADVGVATAQMYPSLSLTASMGQGGFSWPLALSGAGAIWSRSGSLSQPIFHGGALFAQRRAAMATYDAATDAVQADGADRVPECRRYARCARARRAGARRLKCGSTGGTGNLPMRRRHVTGWARCPCRRHARASSSFATRSSMRSAIPVRD
jgi:outer membrane protein TolC